MSHHPLQSRLVRTVCIASCLGVSLALTGCGMNNNLSSAAASSTHTVNLAGKVNGGQQPVYNAVIGLWQAGTTSGYGAGTTNLMTSTVATAADGSFNITGAHSACTSGSMVYITAYGGDPTGSANSSNNNTALMLAAPLGLCDNISSSTSVQINEVTTVAAAYALGQFFGGFGSTGGTGDLIGTSTGNTVGLTNAFATAHNLANVTTGVATTATPTSNGYWLNGYDQQRLNTIANILAACVNQVSASATQCNTLFSDVTPTHAPLSTSTAATAPKDTLQAAVYMLLNPTSANSNGSAANMTALYNLQSAFAPFAPALSAAPQDWTLAISYQGTGIDNLADVAIDANGDVWAVNGNAPGANGGGFVVLNGGTGAVGGTEGIAGTQYGYYTSGTFGSGPTTATINSPRKVAIDKSGYAWTASYGASAGQYISKALASTGVVGSYTTGTATLMYGIAVDPQSGNIFADGSGVAVGVFEAASNGSGAAVTGASVVGGGTAPGTVFNATGTAYQAAQSSSVYEYTIPSSGSVTPTAVAGNPFSAGSTLYGGAIDGNGRVIFTNNANTTLTTITGSGSTQTVGSISSSCVKGGKEVAIDGNNNVWVTNGTAVNVSANGADVSTFTVCEFDSTGALLSPSLGYGPHNTYNARGVAVDQSGNVWVTNYQPNTPNSNQAGTNIVEIVGAAVPVGNPIASVLSAGKMGQRP